MTRPSVPARLPVPRYVEASDERGSDLLHQSHVARPAGALDAGGGRLRLSYGDRRIRAADEVTRLSGDQSRSEEHTSELQSLMRISYAVFCMTTKTYKPQFYP